VGQGQSLAEVLPSTDGWGGLIEQTARGDASALAALYDGTSALVNGLALRILQDPGAAEEVTHDVYLQVWRQASRYDAARGAPLAWLLTLARSRAIDRHRAGAGQRRESEPLAAAVAFAAPGPCPEESSAAAERARLVRGALADLAADQRKTIELAYFGGLSHAEIAATLGEPLGTVKTRIRLGMMRLREALGGTLQEAL
jgi:RNA polymerase sigma-70 factor (ECF subfamily)